MKIINKSKKSEFITCDMHGFDGRFESLRRLKLKLMEEFDDLVPSQVEFEVGYFSGKQSKKHWLIGDDDLVQMYETVKNKSSIFLWCDRRTDSAQQRNCKRPTSQTDAPKSKRYELEAEVDNIVTQLKEIHGDKFTAPQLRMWARYVQAGHYKDLEEPPPLPALKGVPPKRVRKESLSDVIAGAAVSFVNAIRSPDSNLHTNNVVINTPPKGEHVNSVSLISPGRATDLHMRKLKELRELHGLLDQGILSDAEFIEQKAIVLDSLRKLQ